MKKITIVQEDNFDKARKKIREELKKDPSKKIIFSSDNDELNRKILEKEKINLLLINLNKRKDKQKQRDSGFNQVLAKIAKKNKITIGINLDEIIEAKTLKQKSEILARIKQNIKICNKNKIKMKFIATNPKNNRNLHDLKSLGLVLGMHTSIAKYL